MKRRPPRSTRTYPLLSFTTLFRSVPYRKPRLAQRFGGAARRQQFHPVPRKRLPQRHKPRLVGHRKQRPRNLNPAHFLAFRLASPPEGTGDRSAARHDNAADHHLPPTLYGNFPVNPKTTLKTKDTKNLQ